VDSAVIIVSCESARSALRQGPTPTCASARKAATRVSDNNENKPSAALGPEVMRVIGRELRAMYNDIIAEGVPERFDKLLRRLDEPTAPRNDAGNQGRTGCA
jgi:Anti-sigma factor NepR